MPSRPRESLLLTLPLEAGFARTGRLVALHFCRQNGVRRGASAAAARRIERAWRRASQGSRGSGGTASGHGSLLFVAADDTVQVFLRRSGKLVPLMTRLERTPPS